MPQLKQSIETLSGFGTFTKVITCGKKYESKPIKAFVCSHPSNDIKLSIGFAVTRGVRKAVQRNLMKRLIKEAFRTRKENFLKRIESGIELNIVFLYNADVKSSSKKEEFISINKAMANLISTINISCHK